MVNHQDGTERYTTTITGTLEFVFLSDAFNVNVTNAVNVALGHIIASFYHFVQRYSFFDSYVYQDVSVSNFRSQWELYDLKADKPELHNLAEDPAHNATFIQLKKQLMNWRKMTSDYWYCYPQGVLEGNDCPPAYNET